MKDATGQAHRYVHYIRCVRLGAVILALAVADDIFDAISPSWDATTRVPLPLHNDMLVIGAVMLVTAMLAEITRRLKLARILDEILGSDSIQPHPLPSPAADEPVQDTATGVR